jgi:tricorn protease
MVPASKAFILGFGFFFATFVLLNTSPAAAETKLLRFPDVHGKRVVFTYAGDLWTASDKGGNARRLTAHPGVELFAKFSPDGKWIAFTGQYDGDEQVYVVSAVGGVPRQLTYYPARGPLPDRWGYDNQVYGWAPDGQSILFRSLRYGWNIGHNRLYTVSTKGGLPEPLPMPKAGAGDLSPDGKQIAYSPLFRDFRTWKRYQGGWAQDLFIFDLKSHQQRQVTDHVRSDRDPMWIGDRIYFSSDRTDTLNLFYYDLKTKQTVQVTTSTKFDVRWPSRGAGTRIVYELQGRLHLHDTKTNRIKAIKITVPTDALAMRPKHVSVANRVSGYGLSPQGKRVVVAARGDIFSLPSEKGPTRNLTHSSGAHDKSPSWSPNGKQIAFLSDMTGEEEVYVVDAKGEHPPQALTSNGSVMRYSPTWSPDGSSIAFSDKNGKLFVVSVKDKKVVEVADDRGGRLQDFTWSPRGGYLAFSMESPNGFRAIHIWSKQERRTRKITSDMFHEFEPTWDPDGDYLYYFSDRQFAPQLGSMEWNFVQDRETGIFAIALRDDVADPFPSQSDEAVETDDEEKDEAAKDSKEDSPEDKPKKDAKAPLTIDFGIMATRVARVPVTDDNYYGLMAIKGHLIYVRGGASYYGRASDVKPELKIFSLKTRKATTLADAGGYALSGDGKKVLVRQRGGFSIVDATPAGKSSAKSVPTDGLVADVDPQQERQQIFDEVWRRFRDFFYVENMHGYDWEALRRQYRPLLKHAAHRSDMSYVINEMIAELNVGHAYNSGGDFEIPDRASVALPGAHFELDHDSGHYRLVKIFAGQNEEPNYLAPLSAIGVHIGEGEYVLAINGQPLDGSDNPYRLLRNKSDHPVTFTVNAKPNLEGARDVTFDPLTSEHDLVYLDWVLDNHRKVTEASRGRLGYMHLPNMGAEGIREFNKWFYSQTDKEGLVIDVRSNGGGNVSAMIIDRLRRTMLASGYSRNSDYTRTYPSTLFHGHLVCLLDETSASDGDIFPAMFREAGLGPLIGKRSWGGVTGITNRGTLIDGGSINVPEFGFASKHGKWILEGIGVEPDIIVENDPRMLIRGHDSQLQRAIRDVLKRVMEEPRELPKKPAAPVKTPR